MAMFASTTTSGYSDPMKALSIKALEQRMKDMQAQQAAQQPDASMMATIPGGIGHVLGQVGDSFKTMRGEQALAANKEELARTIAAIARNNGEMTPEHQASLARVAPEIMADYQKRQHETNTATNKYNYEGGLAKLQREHEGSQQTQKLTSEELRAKELRESQERITAAQQAGETGRAVIGTTSAEKINERKVTSDESRQVAGFGQEERMARINAEITRVQKDRDQAFAAGQTLQAQAHDRTLENLKSELRGGEERQKEAFRAKELEGKYAQDTKQQELAQAARREEIIIQTAATSGDIKAQNEARERLARIQGDIDLGKQDIRLNFEREQGELDRGNKNTLQMRQIDADKEAAKSLAEAKRLDAERDPKRIEAVQASETDYRKGLSHIENLEEAAKILDNPKGIYTGIMQHAAPGASGIPGVNMFVDKEKAQNTSRYNTIVGEDAIRDMAATLKGSSTNFEMNEFKKMKNDPNISDAQRAAQLRKVVRAAKADLEAQAIAAKKIGGDTARVDKAMGGGGAAADPLEGKTATGPDGAQIIRRDGKWVPK